jgi:hypothetical protein
MSATLAQVLITIGVAQTVLPAGITAGSMSAVVTDSTGAAQPAVTLTGSETPPYSFTASLPISSDGVTVAASVVATALDSNGNAISVPGNPSAPISLTLTEPSFNAPNGTATMALTPAAAAANPAIVAALKAKK